MQPVRIVCEGATIGSVTLPPFNLCAGDLLCLHLPALAGTEDESALLQVLTGREKRNGVRLIARSLAAYPAVPRRGLRRLFGQPTLAGWLAKESGIAPAEAGRQIAEVGLKPTDRLDHVAGTPRLLLGLVLAWTRGAEALVFSLTGLDPLGCERIIQAVRTRLDHCPAILLSYPYTTNGERKRFCPPGALCLEARRGAAA